MKTNDDRNLDVIFEEKEDLQTVSSVLNKNVSLFKGAKTTKPIEEVSLLELLTTDRFKKYVDKCRNITNKEERTLWKQTNAPAYTVSGTFSHRAIKDIKAHSGLIALDLDGVDNIDNLKTMVTTLPFVAYCGKSISGTGLFVIVPIPQSNNDQQRQRFNALQKIFFEKFGLSEKWDNAVKDISRLRFVSYDPDAYLNHSAEIFTLMADAPHTKKNKVSPTTKIEDLAKRHLKEDARYNDYLKFISACANFSTISKDDVIDYIKKNGKSAPDSVTNDTTILSKLIDDIEQRYKTPTSEDIIILDEISFAYDIFKFEYDKFYKIYKLKGLFYDGIKKLVEENGFAKKYLSEQSSILIKKEGAIIEEISVENIKDFVTNYVSNVNDVTLEFNGEEIKVTKNHVSDVYLKQSHLVFNQKWLQQLETHKVPLLRDAENKIRLPFQNGLVTITKDNISDPEPYSNLKNHCIWKAQIINKDFKYLENNDCGEWAKFISNVCNGNEKRIEALQSAMGYLMHQFTKPSQTKAIILNDEEITDAANPKGGTGKGLIANALKEVLSVTKIDGKEFRDDDKFHFQRVTPDTSVIWLDDPKKNFVFETLFSAITDGLTVERKFLPQFVFDPETSPKWLICSNTIMANEGTSNKRRQFIIELSNHYSRKLQTGLEEPIVEEHNGYFFRNDWGIQWDYFFSYMVDCASLYLDCGLIKAPKGNTELNRLIQKTSDDFVNWAEQNITIGRHDTKEKYQEFVSLFYGSEHRFGQRGFSNYVKKFAEYKGWDYFTDSYNGISIFILEKKLRD